MILAGALLTQTFGTLTSAPNGRASRRAIGLLARPIDSRFRGTVNSPPRQPAAVSIGRPVHSGGPRASALAEIQLRMQTPGSVLGGIRLLIRATGRINKQSRSELHRECPTPIGANLITPQSGQPPNLTHTAAGISARVRGPGQPASGRREIAQTAAAGDARLFLQCADR